MIFSEDYLTSFLKTFLAETDGDRRLGSLKNIVILEDDIKDSDKELCKEAELNVYTLKDLYEKGVELAKAGTGTLLEPTPETCSAFSYTSGTTGDPKGVKLTHKMLIMSSFAVKVRSEQCSLNKFVKPIDHEDCYISYLPAAHSFEQCIMAMHFVSGMKCGFYAGNTLKLTEDIAKL